MAQLRYAFGSISRKNVFHKPMIAGIPLYPSYIRRNLATQQPKVSTGQRAEALLALSQEDKVTIVTGGVRGIGLAIVDTIASLGGKVAVLDVLKPGNDFEQVQRQHPNSIKYYRTDVTQMLSLENSFNAAIEDYGRLDNCITAAGVALDKPFLSHEWEECRRLLDINVLGTFFSAQLAAKQMRTQKTGGSIVMIASIAAHCAIPAQRVSIYGATKAAVRLLGKTLAVELAPDNIRINTLSPGFIATEMSRQFTDLQEVFNTVPPMRRIGQKEDLTLAVAYLLSSGASYTTGADIAVTGGLHNGRIEV